MSTRPLVNLTVFWLCLVCLQPRSSATEVFNERTKPASTGEAPAVPSHQTRSLASDLDRQASRPCVAYAGKERVATVGEVVVFYGQAASPDQEIVKYSWDFQSDGLIDFASDIATSTIHTFTEPGEYRCLFKVKDSSGQIAQSVRKILVIAANADRQAAEKSLRPLPIVEANLADGLVHRYAILFNGASEERFWKDVTLCFTMLTNRYDFFPEDIYLLNYDGSSPNGDNPDGIIDYPATWEDLQTVFSRLATIVDLDDEVFFWITDHGRGYSGPLSEGGRVLGYLDGRASVDPGDEPDFPEADFKLRSLMTYGDYICNHGLNVWKVFRSYNGEGKTAFYRNQYVSHSDNVYVETLGAAVSDHDVLIERFIDYPRGDANKDGVVDESIGEVFDYDEDGVPPYDPATGAFDEDDWGQIDRLEDDFNQLNTLLPEGAGAYRLFDRNFEGKLCIDLAYNGQLTIDGRDEDGTGLFDWIDVNQDGDTNDIVSVDEAIVALTEAIYDDDLRALLSQFFTSKITIVAEPCFSGGLVEDLSATNRVICTATIEDAVSYGNVFIRGFVAALHGQDDYGTRVNADTDGDGAVSMLEAFNYAARNDYYNEIPQYDDNGDGISCAAPVPVGSEGLLGAKTYLSGGPGTVNVVNEWTKQTSGYWEEPYWSLGLPNSSQTVEFTNAGWKALTIGANTVNNYSNSLTVNCLTVNAPADSFNLLLLNYAGLKAPLTVHSNLTVGASGSLLSYYTALQGRNFYLASSAGFSENSAITFSNIVLQSNTLAQLNLTNSSLRADWLTLNPTGTLNQIGGTLVSAAMVNSGAVTQSGGTNNIGELTLSYSGLYTLTAGELVTSNTTVQDSYSQFVQNGGNHTIENRLLLTGHSFYSLATGSLSVAVVELSDDAQLYLHGGAVSNSGSVILNAGALIVDGPTQQFGKLEVRTRALLYAGNQSRLGYSLPGPPTTIRFQDSHDVEWTGILFVYLWSPHTNLASGPDHIFVGTNSQGLSAAQLTQVKFVNPAGWPSGGYPARLLPNGELVPAVLPPLALANMGQQLIISWPGGYPLLTATNIMGPYSPLTGAQSPYTNTFKDALRFFRLRGSADPT